MCDATGKSASFFHFLFDRVVEKTIQRLHCLESFNGFFQKIVGSQDIVWNGLENIVVTMFEQVDIRPVRRKSQRGFFELILLGKPVTGSERRSIDDLAELIDVFIDVPADGFEYFRIGTVQSSAP